MGPIYKSRLDMLAEFSLHHAADEEDASSISVNLFLLSEIERGTVNKEAKCWVLYRCYISTLPVYDAHTLLLLQMISQMTIIKTTTKMMR